MFHDLPLLEKAQDIDLVKLRASLLLSEAFKYITDVPKGKGDRNCIVTNQDKKMRLYSTQTGR